MQAAEARAGEVGLSLREYALYGFSEEYIEEQEKGMLVKYAKELGVYLDDILEPLWQDSSRREDLLKDIKRQIQQMILSDYKERLTVKDFPKYLNRLVDVILKNGCDMKKVIRIHQLTIPYTVRRSARAKHVRISVNCDGAVLVTRPAGIPFERIEEIVARKFGWIAGKIDFLRSLRQREDDRLWSIGSRERVLLISCSRVLRIFSQRYGFAIGQISIRNQRTRWGSCSKRGNLNFNHRIVGLAPELVDYVVVHELCHLAELNHSKQFWKLVEQTMPNYNELRKELKQNSL